ncbi:MAG TPA: hypothetical protein VFJ82_10955 [Longimicrobium sp.]|nr:hypothetical protein [Longimicrobium sp.]
MADPLTLLGIALSALGAGGAVNPAVQAARRIRRERSRRRQTHDTPQELFYRSICVGLRIVDADREYIHRREAVIVSRQDGLTRLPWGSRPLGDIQNVEEDLVSDNPAIGLSLVEADPHVERLDGWNRRYIQLSKPLDHNATLRFIHPERSIVTGKPLQHMLRWSPVTRCDQATVQVAFASNPPRTVRYSVISPTGEEVEWELLECDVVTASFTKAIDTPIPGRYYKLSW